MQFQITNYYSDNTSLKIIIFSFYECLNILYEITYQSLCLYTLGFTCHKRNGTLITLQRVDHLSVYTGGI